MTTSSGDTPGGIVVRGLLWDHPRCTRPMAVASRLWREQCLGARLEWSTRPLAAFNDESVDRISSEYDIIFLDHPALGDCIQAACLYPLDELITADVLAGAAARSVGQSHSSYAAGGHQWAIAADVACHVSAWRPDLMDAAGEVVPQTWQDVLSLAHRHPRRVAWPLYPTDAILSMISIFANLAGAQGDLGNADIGELLDRRAFDLLAQVQPMLHPLSVAASPPQVLDRMATGDEIWYVPLTFGYSTYQRGAAVARLRFGPVPRASDAFGCSVLGGAGAAISATARQPNEAAVFLSWLVSNDARCQLARHGGQPDGLDVWRDPVADAAAGGFFSATLSSLAASVLRPRRPGWPAMQQAAGEALAAAIANQSTPEAAQRVVLSAARSACP